MNAPPISKELVEWLLRLFPDRIPDDAEDYDEYLRRVGEQRVIRKLRAVMEEQSRNVLGGTS